MYVFSKRYSIATLFLFLISSYYLTSQPTVDIGACLRLSSLIESDTLNLMLVVDSTNQNKVYWRDISTLATGGGDNDWELHPVGIFTGREGITNPDLSTGNVGIGIVPAPNVGFAVQSSDQVGAFIETNYSDLDNAPSGPVALIGVSTNHPRQNIGVRGIAQSDTITASNVGVSAVAQGETAENVGVFGNAIGSAAILAVAVRAVVEPIAGTTINSPRQYGVQSNAVGSPATSFNASIRATATGSRGVTNSNYGLHIMAHNGVSNDSAMTTNNYGIYVRADGDPSGDTVVTGTLSNYAIYATDINADPNATVSYAGFFNGDVHVTGTSSKVSDERLKIKIRDMGGGLEIIRVLRPKIYEYDREKASGLNLPHGEQYGLIAQDVEKILPSLVTHNIAPHVNPDDGPLTPAPDSYKGIDLQALIPILIKSIQEQQIMIDDLKKKLDQVIGSDPGAEQ